MEHVGKGDAPLACQMDAEYLEAETQRRGFEQRQHRTILQHIGNQDATSRADMFAMPLTMSPPSRLQEEAARCERLASGVTNPELISALLSWAAEYRHTASIRATVVDQRYA